jgi:hypothetical protein
VFRTVSAVSTAITLLAVLVGALIATTTWLAVAVDRALRELAAVRVELWALRGVAKRIVGAPAADPAHPHERIDPPGP